MKSADEKDRNAILWLWPACHNQILRIYGYKDKSSGSKYWSLTSYNISAEPEQTQSKVTLPHSTVNYIGK